ncbi:DUF2147 domain-containing protein [Tardiphaga sp. OK245]|uniref:DUF2147 domain-containing protein n=1 Tax=Tardiphaga sp. OK245 TaxID=1855306 RepID=UPI0008A75B4F|nr:DUF2147 domain-containing protein [Tardiphaga sp. OK245]SEH58360.1 Uncharacterized conserved protein, DUF2147 family [Tardiphaga sp. OK245]
MAARFTVMIALLGVVSAGSAAQAQSGGEATGVWQTQAGDAQVRVSKCGTILCGTVVSLRDKIDPQTGKPPIDDKNPDPALAKRSMIGIHLFYDMRPTGANTWSGRIYNADDGKIYTSNVALVGPNTLKVEGCVGAFCGGENWTRVGR